ncbi:BA14K family protein [Oryzibacter oryziterrae]|uniref:BA14K family protein n=1 Tax=Oryzibacter oryziterrae TaxID=2766474 RepID=UPI001F479FF3|nr:BA14K family protein [Oryzibacter oryziterrae]
MFKGTISAVVIATSLAALPAPAFASHNHRDAFVAGAIGIVGGALLAGALMQPSQPEPMYVQPAPPPPVYMRPAPVYMQQAGMDPHVAWCSSHYRSYNSYDNTWVDMYGRLRVCQSPFDQ